MGEGRDLIVSECGDPVSCHSSPTMFMSPLRVLDLLPGMFASRLVILLSMLLADNMGVSCAPVQFVGALVFFVV
jgi:hypothetical protein